MWVIIEISVTESNLKTLKLQSHETPHKATPTHNYTKPIKNNPKIFQNISKEKREQKYYTWEN